MASANFATDGSDQCLIDIAVAWPIIKPARSPPQDSVDDFEVSLGGRFYNVLTGPMATI